jgi:hypothetical protein
MDYELVKKRLAWAVMRFQERVLHADVNAGSLCQVRFATMDWGKSLLQASVCPSGDLSLQVSKHVASNQLNDVKSSLVAS